jgi:ANTAR domain/GAF domain
MTDGRGARIWAHIAGHAASRGADMSVADVCGGAMRALAITGAWVTAGEPGGSSHFICVTGAASEQLAELQLTLGEGPCIDVLRSGSPVLVPDLAAAHAHRSWPAFAAEARAAGAAAIFALPFRLGTAGVSAGVLAAYRDSPGPLTEPELQDGLILADAAATLLLTSQRNPPGHQPAGAGPGGQSPDLAMHRSQIDQATGMISEQLRVSMPEAFARLRGHAYAQHRSLSEVARDVVTRQLRLSADPDLCGEDPAQP